MPALPSIIIRAVVPSAPAQDVQRRHDNLVHEDDAPLPDGAGMSEEYARCC